MQLQYVASNVEEEGIMPIRRRGFNYGGVKVLERPAMPQDAEVCKGWQQDQAVMLPGMLHDVLTAYALQIAQAHSLMEATLNGADVAELFECEPYASQLQPAFELVAASMEEHDEQGIEKIYFDAWDGDELVADNLWCKASWLSFEDEDASLRFRFSFGMEGFEDVAADPARQNWAARLTDAIFPESAAITEHVELNRLLTQVLDGDTPAYAERIVYFNAPNGGAQMHHDVERGHEGVVFAQLSGATFWLAAAKPVLMDEVAAFLADTDAGAWLELKALVADRVAFAEYLDDRDHELAEALMDREPAFFRYMIERGYAFVLEAGDVLLLPQKTLETCVWHSVICVGDAPGEALSFAIRR